jgi:hypothetical protein
MRDTPTALLTILTLIGAQIEALAAAAVQANLTRGFTLDGRIIGDIGEILAAQFFELELHENQRSRHDAVTTIAGQEHGVQIKCRKASTVIDFTSIPELLLVVNFSTDWRQWGVIYNGPGDIVRQTVLRNPALTIDDEFRIRRNSRRDSVRLNLGQLGLVMAQPVVASVPERTQPLGIF